MSKQELGPIMKHFCIIIKWMIVSNPNQTIRQSPSSCPKKRERHMITLFCHTANTWLVSKVQSPPTLHNHENRIYDEQWKQWKNKSKLFCHFAWSRRSVRVPLQLLAKGYFTFQNVQCFDKVHRAFWTIIGMTLNRILAEKAPEYRHSQSPENFTEESLTKNPIKDSFSDSCIEIFIFH